MSRFKDIKLFSGSAHPVLAKEISEFLEIPLGKTIIKRFADNEVWIEIEENVRQSDAYIIQPTSNPANEHLMELLVMIDALKRASVDTITAVIPYYGYARQDRKTQSRVPITAKLVADLLTAAGAHRIVAVDLHAAQIQGFFNIPFDHIYALPVFLDFLKKHATGERVVVSPDVGGAERARSDGDTRRASSRSLDSRRNGLR